MAEELKVYMDHLIARDDFLYLHSNEKGDSDPSQHPSFLRVRDLFGEDSMVRVLRKPDFQRATWAWSPSECVSLLEDFIKEQIIPSIIMWLSPQKRWYVLDGGHRLSVILAWLKDDWGNEAPSEIFKGDVELESSVKEAANEVNALLTKRGIKRFKDYRDKYVKSEDLAEGTSSFEEEMSSDTTEMIRFYRSLITGSIGFPLQWVKGDYQKAQESFLKINTGGRSLTDWEIKLVQNRGSSFARVVMSISDITRAEHCWPIRTNEKAIRTQVKQNVEAILHGVIDLHKILFEPTSASLSAELKQPLFNEPRAELDKKPAYLAELFTVIEGGKGRETQTEKLLKQDQQTFSKQNQQTFDEGKLVRNGLKLIREGQDVLSHLVGTAPQSLGLVPSIYFYSENGKYVRSSLYGFIYWLFVRNDAEITFQRKLLFSAFRDSFEQVLITKKKEIVNSFSRRGSGPEITTQYASYYQDFLSLLIKHEGNIRSEAFVEEYEEIFGQKSLKASRLSFAGKLSHCSVCMGIVDVIKDGEVVQKKMDIEGSIWVHPFCHINRDLIGSIQRGQGLIDIPSLISTKSSEKLRQLSFLNFENT